MYKIKNNYIFIPPTESKCHLVDAQTHFICKSTTLPGHITSCENCAFIFVTTYYVYLYNNFLIFDIHFCYNIFIAIFRKKIIICLIYNICVTLKSSLGYFHID